MRLVAVLLLEEIEQSIFGIRQRGVDTDSELPQTRRADGDEQCLDGLLAIGQVGEAAANQVFARQARRKGRTHTGTVQRPAGADWEA